MVIRDDNIDAEFLRSRNRLIVDDSYIHRHHKLRPCFRELLNSRDIYAIPFKVTVRNVIIEIRTGLLEEVMEHNASRNAVAVVITPYGYVFVRIYSVSQTNT